MNLLQLLTELDNRISAAKVSGFWSATMKKAWLNIAGVRVCNYAPWKNTELSLTTDSIEDQEYYDYPDEFKPNSIYQLEVDGDPYSRKTWEEYQLLKQNESEEKIFASHNGFYFIFPVLSEDDLEISIWGLKRWVTLVSDTDTSILPSEFDESIIKLAYATALKKAHKTGEANSEIAEVETPKNPNVEGSGGILAKILAMEGKEAPKGYIGKATSSRFA